MTTLIFAAVPVIALLTIAGVGLLWLRQPVDASVKSSEGAGSTLEALDRISRQVDAIATARSRSSSARAASSTRAKAG